MVRCRDGSLYTGIATDVSRRIAEHVGHCKGAKFLRGRGPLTLVCERRVGNRSVASRIEHRIKQLPRSEKEKIAAAPERIDSLRVSLAS